MPKKIDPKTKAAIVAALGAGESTRSTARRFNVSRPCVERLRAEKTAAPRRCPTCGAALAASECLACWLRAPEGRRATFRADSFYVNREPEDI